MTERCSQGTEIHLKKASKFGQVNKNRRRSFDANFKLMVQVAPLSRLIYMHGRVLDEAATSLYLSIYLLPL